MNVSWETALDGSNFSKWNKYVVSDFPKYPKELAHILDQWPAKFHFEIWWLFYLVKHKISLGTKKLCRGLGPAKFTLSQQVLLLILMVLIFCIFMSANSQDGALCPGVCTNSIILQLAFQDIWTSKKKWGLSAFLRKGKSQPSNR